MWDADEGENTEICADKHLHVHIHTVNINAHTQLACTVFSVYLHIPDAYVHAF